MASCQFTLQTSFAPYILVIQTNDIIVFKLTKYTVDDSFADRLVVQDPNLVQPVSKPHPCCIYAETQVSHDSKVPFLSCGLEAFLQTADHEVNTSSSVVSALTLILSGGLFEVRIIGDHHANMKRNGRGAVELAFFSTPD